MPSHGSTPSPCVLSWHSSVDFIDQLSKLSLAVDGSGDCLQHGEEHFGSDCTFQTGGKCLFSSFISSASDPLSVILASFVSHLTPHLEALCVRYWICYSVLIWHCSRNQSVINKQEEEMFCGTGTIKDAWERQHTQHTAALQIPEDFWGKMRQRLLQGTDILSEQNQELLGGREEKEKESDEVLR